MTEPQEFDSIDELFRQTFKDLPESPAPNGWDVPSERVWDHVRTHMPTPKQGWTWRAWSMAGALVVVLALGLYWMSTLQPAPQAEPLSPAPSEAPVQELPANTPAEVAASDEEPAPAKTSEGPAVVAPRPASGAVRPKPVAPNHAAATGAGDSVAEEKSVDKRPYPNNAERRRAEELRKRWNTAITPLPTVMEKQ